MITKRSENMFPQCLCENVSKLIVCRYPFEFDAAFIDEITNVIVFDIDMLRSIMVTVVFTDSNSGLIVNVDGCWCFDGDIEFGE